MRGNWTRQSFGALVVMGLAVACSSTFNAAEARGWAFRNTSHYTASHAGRFTHYSRYARHGMFHRWASVLQCVPFARENSGIELTGNAGNWWDNAEGLYARGARPEVGSILNFRASGRMRMGHVAVVTNVVDSRHIEIDHANWSGPGRISRDIDVVDVSPSNDWTAVRVALDRADDDFGSSYPTYGFIYDRPDTGVMVANTGVIPTSAGVHTTPEPAALATAPEEVAEAADDPAPRGYAYHHRGGHYRVSMRVRQYGHYASRASLYRVSSHSAVVSTHHRRRF